MDERILYDVDKLIFVGIKKRDTFIHYRWELGQFSHVPSCSPWGTHMHIYRRVKNLGQPASSTLRAVGVKGLFQGASQYRSTHLAT